MIVTGLEPATSRPVILRSTIDLHDRPILLRVHSFKSYLQNQQKFPIKKFLSLALLDNYKIQNQIQTPKRQMLQSQMFEESSVNKPENQEEFEALLNSLLPEIEQQLMKDIEQQLQNQFQQKYQKSIQDIQNQAFQQYEQAVNELQESRQLLQQQKQSQIQKQIQFLQSTLASLQEKLLTTLQEKFLEEHFDSRVMSHPSIQELQKQIEEQIFEALEQKHEVTKQRQLKQLIIAHETKEIKLRKQLDQQIKSRIYCSSGLQELKQQIKQSKTQMGSQKSEYNLRLKKIQTEIKEYQDRIKEYEKMPDLQTLREKYEELKVDIIEKQTEVELQNDEKKRNTNNQQNSKDEGSVFKNEGEDSLDQNQQAEYQLNNFPYHQGAEQKNQHSKSKTLKRQQRNQLLNLESQYPYDKQPEIYQDFSQSSNQSYSPSQDNSKKFDLTAYFKGYLLNSQTAKITQSQDIVLQSNPLQKKSLLSLQNVSDLLKQKISMDPLERYLNQQNLPKENDINAQNLNFHTNQKNSNFAQLYEQHLKKLNMGFARKIQTGKSQCESEGLSQMAKKTIIKNLSAHHKDKFCNNTDMKKYNQKNKHFCIQDSYKSYQSNLLASYK